MSMTVWLVGKNAKMQFAFKLNEDWKWEGHFSTIFLFIGSTQMVEVLPDYMKKLAKICM